MARTYQAPTVKESATNSVEKMDIVSENAGSASSSTSKKARTTQILIKIIIKDIQKVLSKKGQVHDRTVEELIECLQEASLRAISIQTVMDTQIGVTLRELYDFVKSDPLFQDVKTVAKTALRAMKREACKEIFGYDIDCKTADTTTGREEDMAEESSEGLRKIESSHLFKEDSKRMRSVSIENGSPDDAMTQRETENKENGEVDLNEQDGELPMRDPELVKSIKKTLAEELQMVLCNVIINVR